MEQRLKNYLKFYGETAGGSRKIEGDKGEFLSQMLIQIGFFQHERLIHLIVTVLFCYSCGDFDSCEPFDPGMGGIIALLDVFCAIDSLHPSLLYFGKWRAETV